MNARKILGAVLIAAGVGGFVATYVLQKRRYEVIELSADEVQTVDRTLDEVTEQK